MCQPGLPPTVLQIRDQFRVRSLVEVGLFLRVLYSCLAEVISDFAPAGAALSSSRWDVAVCSLCPDVSDLCSACCCRPLNSCLQLNLTLPSCRLQWLAPAARCCLLHLVSPLKLAVACSSLQRVVC